MGILRQLAYQPASSESRLVKACRAGNRRAQRTLYDQYKVAMFTLAMRLLNHREEAEDALQEGFVKVFKSIDSFREESSLGAWIKTIVTRTCISRLKKRLRLQEQTMEGIEVSVNWDANLTGEVLQRAIAALPDGYRTVFVMVEIEGYSHQEVADLLEVSVVTSRSQLFHAKRKLQQALRGYYYSS